MKTSIFRKKVTVTFLVVIALGFAACPNDTKSEPSKVINMADIQGVTAPVAGETPVTEIVGTAQYTGTVGWEPKPDNDTFKMDTVYTATITLKAKKGFTLKGVKAGFFKVDGAETTNAANKGVITAVFPITLMSDPIVFTDPVIEKFYGDKPFTNASTHR
ncbi:MAG: hypothetical protein LBI28_01720, partial [Treponema sp.]|nr:hypothetical protein [Treponema sp.]